MKVVIENADWKQLEHRLRGLNAVEYPVEGTVVIDAATGNVFVRPPLRRAFVLPSDVIVYPGVPGEACVTFEGGYYSVVGLLAGINLLSLPIPKEFPTFREYNSSAKIPA